MQHKTSDKLKHCIVHTFMKRSNSAKHCLTSKPCYCKDDCAMCPIYKLFTLIFFTLTATILCADFDSERI